MRITYVMMRITRTLYQEGLHLLWKHCARKLHGLAGVMIVQWKHQRKQWAQAEELRQQEQPQGQQGGQQEQPQGQEEEQQQAS
jgi:hypothetical protein